MPNERHYNELNLESVGINLPYNMQAEQSVLGAVLLRLHVERLVDAHALQIQFVVIMSFVRHGRSSFCQFP